MNQAFASAATTLGGIDALLVPAAVVNKYPEPQSIDDAEWDRVINNDLRSVFLTNQEIFPYLVDNGGGRIINFGSGAAFRPYPAVHYSAAKGGVIAWTRSIAYAWGRHNITANVVSPSVVGTRMFSKDALTPELHERVKSGFPLGARRFPPPVDEDLSPTYGDPDSDLGPVLVFLVGDGARFITAQIIPVDGGSTPAR